MGMFRDMKDAFGVIRSDELKELKRKADARPKTSMMDGIKMANEAMDAAQDYENAMAGAGGMGTNPFSNAATMAGGLMGTATVTALTETGTEVNNAPVMELDLMVTVDGGEPYPVKHRQLIAHSALINFQPGKQFTVRVDPKDRTSVVLG